MPERREVLPPQAGVYVVITHDATERSQVNNVTFFSSPSDASDNINPILSTDIILPSQGPRSFTVNGQLVESGSPSLNIQTSLGNFTAQSLTANNLKLIGPPNRIWIDIDSSIVRIYNRVSQTAMQYEPSAFDTLLSAPINYQLLPGETIAPSSASPTFAPSAGSQAPTAGSLPPTFNPTDQPTTDRPSLAPTGAPSARSQAPTAGSRAPTAAPAAPPPTFDPTRQPSAGQTFSPSAGSRGPTFAPVGVTSSTFAPAGAITTLGPTPQAITSGPTPGAGGGGGSESGGLSNGALAGIALGSAALVIAGVAALKRHRNQYRIVEAPNPDNHDPSRARFTNESLGIQQNPAFRDPRTATSQGSDEEDPLYKKFRHVSPELLDRARRVLINQGVFRPEELAAASDEFANHIYEEISEYALFLSRKDPVSDSRDDENYAEFLSQKAHQSTDQDNYAIAIELGQESFFDGAPGPARIDPPSDPEYAAAPQTAAASNYASARQAPGQQSLEPTYSAFTPPPKDDNQVVTDFNPDYEGILPGEDQEAAAARLARESGHARLTRGGLTEAGYAVPTDDGYLGVSGGSNIPGDFPMEPGYEALADLEDTAYVAAADPDRGPTPPPRTVTRTSSASSLDKDSRGITESEL